MSNGCSLSIGPSVLVSLAVFFVAATGRADEEKLQERIRELEEENRVLIKRIVEMELQKNGASVASLTPSQPQPP